MGKQTFDIRERELGVREYGTEELEILKEVLDSGLLSHLPGGKYVPEFEKIFAEAHNTKHAIAMSSCMGALHTALVTLGVGAGDEVICDALHAFGTLAVTYTNAIPTYADIDPVTLNMDPQKIEKAITKRTKAILLTHAWGLTAEMDRIMEIADKHDLPVIEDCAVAVLGKYKGKYVGGSWGDIGCYSFQASKQLNLGDAGMLTTNSKEIADKARLIGGAPTAHSVAVDMHFNYRINELTAAMGIAQFKKLPAYLKELKTNASYYDEAVSDCEWIDLQRGPVESDHMFWHWAAIFNGEDYGISIPEFKSAIEKAGVRSVNIGYTKRPPYLQPLITERRAHGFHCSENKDRDLDEYYKEGLCPIAEKVIPRIILVYPVGCENDVKEEAEKFHNVIKSFSK